MSMDVPEQQLRVEVGFAELADPADTPRPERLHHRPELATGLGEHVPDVVAADLTPELLMEGERLADQCGVRIEWREADAEALPFATDEFDVVMSCVGVMFAPHHPASADELVRVCRAGGTIGLLNWTPAGYIGQMFATMKPYAPPPPPGAQPPPLWAMSSTSVRYSLTG